jgi:hypothetical protein
MDLIIMNTELGAGKPVVNPSQVRCIRQADHALIAFAMITSSR